MATEMANPPNHHATQADQVLLCDICSRINFDVLRAPTLGQLRRLQDGEEDPGIVLYRSKTQRSWDLGKMERILPSASSCSICAWVARMYHDINSVQPGRITPEATCHASLSLSPRSFRPRENGRIHPEMLRRLDCRRTEAKVDVRVLGASWRQASETVDETETLSEWDPNSADGMEWMFDRLQGAPEDTPILCGRRSSPMIRVDLLRSWLNTCLGSHKECGIDDETPKISTVFRLINVRQKSITRFTNINVKSLRYAALSYVWGATQKLTITRKNRAELGTPGSLAGCRTSRTIEEAMAVTEQLGLEYLWVDGLCIIQDDTTDKLVHLAFMSDIYEAATVTLIAASGSDSSAGLAGLAGVQSSPRGIVQTVVKVREGTETTPRPLHLVSSQSRTPQSSTSYLDGTVWTTRGWTLQERVLSRRTITFTATEVYWECQRCTWTESVFAELGPALGEAEFAKVRGGQGFLAARERDHPVPDGKVDEADVPWAHFGSLLEEYSRRSLTVPGDGYDAFLSVVQGLADSTGSACLWALPVVLFERGLCWRRGVDESMQPLRRLRRLKRRTCLTTLPSTSMKRKVPFPSWSPLGWIGVVQMRLTDPYPQIYVSTAIVAYVLRNNPVRVVKVSMVTGEGTETPMSPRPSTFRPNPRAVSLEAVARELPHLTPDRLASTPDDQLIFFWTEVAAFSVKGPLEVDAYSGAGSVGFRYGIFPGAASQVVGNNTGLCVPEDPGDENCVAGEGEFDFVLVAVETYHWEKTMCVLQVVWRDGIAYRISMGDIKEKEWQAARPEMRLVVMG